MQRRHLVILYFYYYLPDKSLSHQLVKFAHVYQKYSLKTINHFPQHQTLGENVSNLNCRKKIHKLVFSIFQKVTIHPRPQVGIIFLTLVLVVTAVFLFLVLLAMVCVTLASEDQICLASHMETAGEVSEDVENCVGVKEETQILEKNSWENLTKPLLKIVSAPIVYIYCKIFLSTDLIQVK